MFKFTLLRFGLNLLISLVSNFKMFFQVALIVIVLCFLYLLYKNGFNIDLALIETSDYGKIVIKWIEDAFLTIRGVIRQFM